jgi:PAS domain S-box-containing protein
LRAAPLSGRSPSDAKLGLAEFFLGADAFGPCAQTALEWLGRHCNVKIALCLATLGERDRLNGVASLGINALDAAEYGVDLASDRHPLVGVLRSGKPTYFRAGQVRDTPMGPRSLLAYPLGARREEDGPRGLLLIPSSSPTIDPDVAWASELLSEKLARLRASGLTSEVESHHERALFSSLLNAVTDPILLTDTEGKVIIANALAERLFTSQDDDSEGRRRAVSLNNLLFSSALAKQFGEHHEPGGRNELALVDPTEGSDLLFELLSSIVRQPSGQQVVVSVLRNITDLGRASRELGENYRQLREAQAEARHERLRMDLVIDSVADPIVVTNENGDIVLMNKPAERFLSTGVHDHEEAHRRVRSNDAHFSSFVSKLFLSESKDRFRDDLALVEPESGQVIPMEAVAGRIHSETGEHATLVTIFHDRTEALEKAKLYEQLKQFSEELEAKVQAATADIVQQNELLRRQAIALEQASAAKSQFLANMSHEFRTPLNAILGYTSMMLQGVAGDLPASAKKSLQRVDSNGRHLLQVINEILDITRIEAGRMPLNATEFELHSLIGEVQNELEPIVARSNLQMKAELPKRLPAVYSDRQKVKQILLNLLSNAIKFTHEGWVKISVVHDPRHKRLMIGVTDTGIGIAKEDHAKIFEDFQQVDASTTRAYGGTGLGLAICGRLAQMMDGSIELQSELGKGSTFTLTIPVRVKHA